MIFRPVIKFRSSRTAFASYEAALADATRGSTSYSIFTTREGGTVSAKVYEPAGFWKNGNVERTVILYRLQKLNKKSKQRRWPERFETPKGKWTNTEMSVVRRPTWIVERVEIPEHMIHSARQHPRHFDIRFSSQVQ